MTITKSQPLEQATTRKEDPKTKPGLIERWKIRPTPAKVLNLLNSAIKGNGNARENFESAVSVFEQLEPSKQHKVFLKIEKNLVSVSHFTLESDYKAREAHVIAQFIAKTAHCLPKDEFGDPISKPYQKTIDALARIAESDGPGNARSRNAHVVLTCTHALWELAYAYFYFWQDRVVDPITQDMAITFMLDMPRTENAEAHGWHLLGECLPQIGFALAKNISTNKSAFLREMIATKPKSAFRSALYLDEDLGEFVEIAHKLAATQVHLPDAERDQKLLEAAFEFMEVLKLSKQLRDPKKQPYALDRLLKLYQTKRSYLLPLIKDFYIKTLETSQDGWPEERLNALLTLNQFAAIKFQGQTSQHVQIQSLVDGLLDSGDYAILKRNVLKIGRAIALSFSEKKIDFIKSMIQDTDPVAVRDGLEVALNLPVIPQELKDAAAAVDGPAKNAAEEFLYVTDLKEKLMLADGTQFVAAEHLVNMYLRGKNYLLPTMFEISLEMADIFRDPGGNTEEEKARQKEQATKIIVLLATAGIKTPGFNVNFKTKAPPKPVSDTDSVSLPPKPAKVIVAKKRDPNEG
ncbi:hypothetical protein KKB44_01960 [Candidatus Micrarchaeota archaeon]|nr:hypothetical protein [Candidatus Micrarchaeota archaeon]